MTTTRRIVANRQNAQRSTGPRSPGGKARASQNALRHGLSTLRRQVAASEPLDELAEALAGDGAAPQTAFSSAEVQLEMELLWRVWLRIRDTFRTATAGPSLSLDYEQLIVELNRIERYERRAMGRWLKARRQA